MPACVAIASGTPVPEEIGTNPKPACVDGSLRRGEGPPRNVPGISAYYRDTAPRAGQLLVLGDARSPKMQTVTQEGNPLLYDLLSDFERATGSGVLVNTFIRV